MKFVLVTAFHLQYTCSIRVQSYMLKNISSIRVHAIKYQLVYNDAMLVYNDATFLLLRNMFSYGSEAGVVDATTLLLTRTKLFSRFSVCVLHAVCGFLNPKFCLIFSFHAVL